MIHNNQCTKQIDSINIIAQRKPSTHDIRGSPQFGATSTNCFFFFIRLQYPTFICSCALSHKAKLCTRQVICALSARSTFPKLGQGKEPTPLSNTEPYIHVILYKATQNYLPLALSQLHPPHYITLFLVYTFTIA
jgi:hypothetical protein